MSAFKQVILTTAYAALDFALKRLTSPDFMQALKDLVLSYMDDDISGAEKKEAVLEELKQLGQEVGEMVVDMSGSLLNLALEAAVAYVKFKLN